MFLTLWVCVSLMLFLLCLYMFYNLTNSKLYSLILHPLGAGFSDLHEVLAQALAQGGIPPREMHPGLECTARI